MAPDQGRDPRRTGNYMEIEDKLSKVRFNIDNHAHLVLDREKCKICPEKPCLFVCPFKNYVLNEGEIVLSWQGCMECGACRIICSREAIEWTYPRGGFGVCLRYG